MRLRELLPYLRKYLSSSAPGPTGDSIHFDRLVVVCLVTETMRIPPLPLPLASTVSLHTSPTVEVTEIRRSPVTEHSQWHCLNSDPQRVGGGGNGGEDMFGPVIDNVGATDRSRSPGHEHKFRMNRRRGTTFFHLPFRAHSRFHYTPRLLYRSLDVEDHRLQYRAQLVTLPQC